MWTKEDDDLASETVKSAIHVSWIILIFGIFFAVTLIALIYVSYGAGFATRPARLNNAQRQEQMSARMNNAYQALQASQVNVDLARQRVLAYETAYGEDQSLWPQGVRAEWLQDKQHFTNAIAAYNRACGEYIAVYADEYRAIAAPDDLPKTCAMISG